MSDLDKYKNDIAKDYDALRDTRIAANEDMRFIGVDGGMWEDFLSDSYSDNRVKLELDITSPYVMRYIGERNMNRANVVFTPDDVNTSPDDADLLNGIYRSDFKDNDGQISQDAAIYETAVCGMGAFKISTRFVDEEDPENENQETVWTPIINAYDHVMFDDTATRADKADAKRVTVLTGHSPEAFKDQWPTAQPTSAYTPESSFVFNWFTREVVYVAERYEIKTVKEKVQVWQHVASSQIKAFPDSEMETVKPELDALGWEFVRIRKMKRRTVWKTIFNGNEILEKSKRIPGKWLPIIPMYGVRTYVGNVENFRGLVRKLKDANRVLNTSVSRMTEDSSVTGNTLPIFTRDQVKSNDIKNAWADKSDKAYLVVDPQLDQNGQAIPFTGIATLPTNQIDPNTLGVVDIVSNFVQRETGNAPQDTIDPDASGKAIDALKQREDLSTQVITDNIHQSIKHSGKVWEAISGDIYTRSQMKKVLGIDGTMKYEQINGSSLDPQTGNPITINDLTRGRFSVDIELGPQYESQKAATIGSLERVIEKVGEDSALQPALIGAWIENIEGTGLEGVKELNRNNMIRQGIVKPETPEEEQIAAQAQSQTDPNDELVKAATMQQQAEAKNLEASSVGKMATAQKELATAEKTKAETAEIVTDIGIKQSEQVLRRFAKIPVGPANVG
jgi:hypothetical protein